MMMDGESLFLPCKRYFDKNFIDLAWHPYRTSSFCILVNQADSECIAFREFYQSAVRDLGLVSQKETRSLTKLRIGSHKLIINSFLLKQTALCFKNRLRIIERDIPHAMCVSYTTSCIDYSSFKSSSPNVCNKFLLFCSLKLREII